MHTIFCTYLINEECPEGKDENNCPLQEYLKTEHLFKVGKCQMTRRNQGKLVTERQNILIPTRESFSLANREYNMAIATMNAVCKVCKNENNK